MRLSRFVTFLGLMGLPLLLIAGGCRKVEPPLPYRVVGPVPFDPQRSHDRDFPPNGSWEQLSENLFVYRDTCNVYVVRRGEAAVLIDYGSGGVRAILGELGVRSVDRVLVTHHHRDQIQGLARPDVPTGFRVFAPAREAYLMEAVEEFWDEVRIDLNYDLRSRFNSASRNIRVDEQVLPGDAIQWLDLEFKVLETPGQTEHSVSYVAKIDGRKVAFTGDLIAGEGKVHNWFDLHWDYYGFTQGINASEQSFEVIEAESPELLLPSHGEPIASVATALAANRTIHQKLRSLLPPNQLRRSIGEMRRISPHLVHLGGAQGQSLGELTSYAILSDSGKAFLYDYGYVDLRQIERLKREFSVNSIDVVSFSHYHDDHLIRTYELRREDRPRFWVLSHLVDILEHPERYRLPCLVPFPIKVDRILQPGEKVQWEEYELEFFHMPGQTEFHQGMFAVIDGKRVLFTGDNTWKKMDPTRPQNGPLVPQNQYFLDGGFITCARRILDYRPDLICPAHTEEFLPEPGDLEQFLDWALELREVMTQFIDQPDPNFGMDDRWCHFYPYRSRPPHDGRFQVELRMRNHLFRPARIEVRLQLPPGVTADHPVRNIEAAAKTEVAIPFQLHWTADTRQRGVLTADIRINGRHLGEVAEALIN